MLLTTVTLKSPEYPDINMAESLSGKVVHPAMLAGSGIEDEVG